MLAAAVNAVKDLGYTRLTVAQVIARAGVSRKTFYEVFADREDCFLAACEHAISEATLVAKEAYERESSWREGIRVALSRLLAWLDDDHGAARVFVVESLAAGGRVLQRRAELLRELAEIIDEGGLLNNGAHGRHDVTGEAVVGGVVALLYARLLDRHDEPLSDLLGPMMSVIVLPYLGARAARHELDRPARLTPPGRQLGAPTSNKDGIADLKMRLSNRTLRVLKAIADHPGASNREVADGSGIVDQGQISRLLSRLAGLNLVENLGDSKERGAPNAWRLTSRGAQIERAACATGGTRLGI